MSVRTAHVDRITYDYENRNSRITVIKNVGPSDV